MFVSSLLPLKKGKIRTRWFYIVGITHTQWRTKTCECPGPNDPWLFAPHRPIHSCLLIQIFWSHIQLHIKAIRWISGSPAPFAPPHYCTPPLPIENSDKILIMNTCFYRSWELTVNSYSESSLRIKGTLKICWICCSQHNSLAITTILSLPWESKHISNKRFRSSSPEQAVTK